MISYELYNYYLLEWMQKRGTNVEYDKWEGQIDCVGKSKYCGECEGLRFLHPVNGQF